MRLVLLLPFLLAADGSSLEVPAPLQGFLDSGQWDQATPKSFRIIALSHLADGCANQGRQHPERREAAHACIEQVLARAKALQGGDGGLFLTHLSLIYGAADEVGPCLDEARHRRLAQTLARRSLADPLKHAASYGGTELRWPADQTATLAGLARFDHAHGTSLTEAPFTAWKEVIAQRLDPATGLPWSEVSGRGPGARHPRGCAQSFISRYLVEVDPPLAASWWRPYRDRFLVRLGPVVGFREWPPGVERPGDLDSGPIVMGIGVAASAFAISAAKAQGDLALAAQLEGSAEAVRAMGVGGKAGVSVLASAIAFEARWR